MKFDKADYVFIIYLLLLSLPHYMWLHAERKIQGKYKKLPSPHMFIDKIPRWWSYDPFAKVV